MERAESFVMTIKLDSFANDIFDRIAEFYFFF